MTGLYEQIEVRRVGKILERNEPLSYSNISKLLNVSYNTAVRKVGQNTLTVAEALKIYKSLDFKSKDKFEAFEYLFSEKEEE